MPKTYLFQTHGHGRRAIGVHESVGTFVVGWLWKDGTVGRVESADLPSHPRRELVQRALDQFAARRQLEEICEKPACSICGDPATQGYADMPATLVCNDCSLIRKLPSVQDGLEEIRKETSSERLIRALRYEENHAKRTTITHAIISRMRSLKN